MISKRRWVINDRVGLIRGRVDAITMRVGTIRKVDGPMSVHVGQIRVQRTSGLHYN